MTTKKKIAILGGGPAGLAAAWQLTHEDGWQEHYDVTVYQQGWRCGGKCATGRGPANRVQEHGIHVLMGSYDSVFTIVEDVYGARATYGVAPDSPFASWSDAFGRIDATLLSDSSDPTLIRWQAWPVIFPQNELTPGQGPPTPLWTVLGDVLGTGLSALLGSPYASGTGPIRRWILSWFFPESRSLTGPVAMLADAIHDPGSVPSELLESTLDPSHSELHREALAKAAELTARVHGHPEGLSALDDVLDLLEHILQGIERWAHLAADVIARDIALIEFAVVGLRGLIEDCWDTGEGAFDFAKIDHLDLRAWMKSHGASQRCLYSSPMRFMYAGTFSNDIGDGDGGLFAAGTAMRSAFKMLAYKGSLVYQMRAGTGDTMIAPIFQILEARGVEFAYFHQITNIRDDPDGVIREVEVKVQARVRELPYRPLKRVEVEGGAIDAWPDRPLWDQLDPDDAAELKRVGWQHDCVRAEGHAKKLVYGEDFTHLVLATPVATLPHIAKEIVDRVPAWRRTVELVKATPTQSFQLWFEDDNVALGVPLEEWGMQRPNLVPNNETYANGFTAWGDATVTAAYETWDETPGAISYFCGAFTMSEPYDERSPVDYAREHKGAEARAQQWCVDNAGWIFRDATTKDQPYGLDYGRLAIPHDTAGVTPSRRWAAQYFRANVEPTGLYTLTLPKTIAERLRFDDTGFENLVAAGDWVGHDGINAGFVDGAMLCGRQAALELRARLALPSTREPLFATDVKIAGGRAE